MGASQAKANIQAAERLCQQLERAGLGHFARVRQLATHFICEDAVGPCVQPSQVFVAFDLLRSGDITTKVYFMPHVRAATTNKTALRIIEDAIRATEGQQHAWRLICDYLQDRSRLTREPDPVILSTDCVDTSKARLKIYFRFRTSRKQDMISAMSLGGRIGFDWEGPIRQVCDAVLGREQEDIDPLKTCEDLTGGFLVYYNFCSASNAPSSKIYIPVRLWGQSDAVVTAGVTTLLGSYEHLDGESGPIDSINPESSFPYEDTIAKILPDHVQHDKRGLQNYVCLARKDSGRIELSTYLNPLPPELDCLKRPSLMMRPCSFKSPTENGSVPRIAQSSTVRKCEGCN